MNRPTFSSQLRNGLSLLEMMIATAILMAAAITMAQLSFVTSKNAKRAEDRTMAQQIASHQIQQVLAGLIPAIDQTPQAVLDESEVAVDTAQSKPHPWDDWQYSITTSPGKVPGTLQVQVNVFRLPIGQAENDNLAAGPSNSNADNLDSTSTTDSADQVPDAVFRYSLNRLVYTGVSSINQPSAVQSNEFLNQDF